MLNFIKRLFNRPTELQQFATDRNLLLVGYADNWLVLNSDSIIVGTGITQVDALTQAIFRGK